MSDNDKHLVKFCQCTFADYLAKMNKDNDEDDNTELSSNITNDSNIKEEET